MKENAKNWLVKMSDTTWKHARTRDVFLNVIDGVNDDPVISVSQQALILHTVCQLAGKMEDRGSVDGLKALAIAAAINTFK